MALETERCSPSNAASPGPTTGRRPGSQGTAAAQDKPKSAFHQIALLTRCASPPAESDDCRAELSAPRPPSAGSSSNSVQRPPYSDSSPPSSPPGPHSPDRRNGFLYHPDMASLSLVYGLGVGVVPGRFPLSLHLPGVYPAPEPFGVLPRVPTVVPVKPPDPLGAFVSRHLAETPEFVESRLLGPSKPLLTPKVAEAVAPRCDCCRSPSPRSPSPRQPPGPSSLTFSVDNILRPDFGRCRAQQRRVRTPKSVKPPEVEILPPKILQAAALETPATPARSITPASDDKDTNDRDWPAWVYCTRYSDRPSSGPRSRRMKRKEKRPEEKRPRTAFSGEQLSRLKSEFAENRYLTEKRRQQLAVELGLNEAQIKIWFQNKRAKLKKATGKKNPLALRLMAQGLYNHSTVALSDDEEESESSGPRQ